MFSTKIKHRQCQTCQFSNLCLCFYDWPKFVSIVWIRWESLVVTPHTCTTCIFCSSNEFIMVASSRLPFTEIKILCAQWCTVYSVHTCIQGNTRNVNTLIRFFELIICIEYNTICINGVLCLLRCFLILMINNNLLFSRMLRNFHVKSFSQEHFNCIFIYVCGPKIMPWK